MCIALTVVTMPLFASSTVKRDVSTSVPVGEVTRVVVEVEPFHLDRPFDYLVGDAEVVVGSRVEVVFAGRVSEAEGLAPCRRTEGARTGMKEGRSKQADSPAKDGVKSRDMRRRLLRADVHRCETSAGGGPACRSAERGRSLT